MLKKPFLHINEETLALSPLRMSGKEVFRKQKGFRSKGNNAHTVETKKLALSRDNDKWIINKDLISTLARGHHDLVWSLILGEVSLE